jgi:N4-(beta-N-acetylglucosaminyl)-L-asparaginase
MIVTSHRNDTGQEAMRAGWDILAADGTALDAVEAATNIIEVDPQDASVGYGGLPNQDGVVQLDASIMDGRTYNAGAVAAIENIKNPSSVARLVMEQTDHVILVGEGALDFARKWGFDEENLLTERARAAWLNWRINLSDTDDWGPPDHLVGEGAVQTGARFDGPVEYEHGTVNVLAIDSRGDIAGITSTSGLSWKIPGRIGDSPIIGAGLYVDNEVGAAAATGRGEDVIKSCASYYIVLRMKDGRTPQEACEDALRMILDRYRNVNPEFVPGEKFVAVNRDGEFGCAWMGIGGLPRMTVADAGGLRIYEGTAI